MPDFDDEADEFRERKPWPWWVSLGLWGLPSRTWAWACFWGSLVLAVACVAYGFVRPIAFIGGGFVFAALWYYVAIRWVDQHSEWP